MATTINFIRYHKQTKYGDHVFLANSKNPIELKNHSMLKSYAAKLRTMTPDAFLPIYCSDTFHYCTITIKKNESMRKLNLNMNDLLSFEFVVRRRNTVDKIHINIYADSVKLISRAAPVDLGDAIDMGDGEVVEMV